MIAASFYLLTDLVNGTGDETRDAFGVTKDGGEAGTVGRGSLHSRETDLPLGERDDHGLWQVHRWPTTYQYSHYR